MQLIINGQARAFDSLSAGDPVSALVALLGLQPERVALEQNGVIVSRGAWPQAALAEEDRIEVVHFVGGGAGVRSPDGLSV